jgi:hypothetical protein
MPCTHVAFRYLSLSSKPVLWKIKVLLRAKNRFVRALACVCLRIQKRGNEPNRPKFKWSRKSRKLKKAKIWVLHVWRGGPSVAQESCIGHVEACWSREGNAALLVRLHLLGLANFHSSSWPLPRVAFEVWVFIPWRPIFWSWREKYGYLTKNKCMKPLSTCMHG